VQEIDRVQTVTRVPQALSFVEGVIHLRGAIIPVVDLARRFCL
jgi:purine-binding chemotaxis protein CheW